MKDKFTLEFVSMADYYNVEDLVLDCTEYLKKKDAEVNVFGI